MLYKEPVAVFDLGFVQQLQDSVKKTKEKKEKSTDKLFDPSILPRCINAHSFSLP
jgi:hypothetical protein